MSTNYILVDFENIQPKNFDVLADRQFKTFLFVGAKQSKLSVDVVVAIQKLGEKAQIIPMSFGGPNALDFFIAYYVGMLAAKEPTCNFHIVSKDRGFEPLILQLKKSEKVRIVRVNSLLEIPLSRLPRAATNEEKIAAIVEDLNRRGNKKPRKIGSLANTIKSLFAMNISDAEIKKLIGDLMKHRYIIENNGSISYNLQRKT